MDGAGRTLVGLLVGIDAYRPPVRALHGCVADVERVANLLERRAAAAGDTADLRILTDDAATRHTVIAGFRSHLAAAGPQDTALFYYAGHGSQEPAVLPEHRAVEPDGLNETLVLADSRRPGSRDLADKELAVLVGEVAARAGHTLVVLDCCHSGSGTRAPAEEGLTVRRAPMDTRPRPAASYLPGATGGAGGGTAGGAGGGTAGGAGGGATGGTGMVDAVAHRTRGVGVDGGVDGAGWLGSGHRGAVLLAACRPDQTAKEVRLDGVRRGAFSVALERALAGLPGRPTYLDVHRWVAAAVRNLADQSPVLEAPSPADARRPFLGGVAAPSVPVLTAAHVPGRGWVLDAGRIDGISPGTEAEPAVVALFALGVGALGVGMAGVAGEVVPLTKARVVEVGATTSLLEPADPGVLDPLAVHRAAVVANGPPSATVVATGVPDAVRARLTGSAVVRLVDDDGDLAVEGDDAGLAVVRSGRVLDAVEGPIDDAAVERIVAVCEHVGRWLALAARRNPTSRLAAQQVELAVLDLADVPVPCPHGAAELRYGGPGLSDPPVVRVRYANRSGVPLHCAVLALSELYGITCLTRGGSELLQPGAEAFVLDHDDRPQVSTFVPADRERTTDLLKLVASTEPFDARSCEQEDLRPARATRAGGRGVPGVPGAFDLPGRGQDWTTREVLVTTTRPR